MELKHILESILFSAQEPLSVKDLRDVLKNATEHSPEAGDFKKVPFEEVVAALDALIKEHEAAQRSYRLVCVAERWQFVIQPEFAPWVKALVGGRSTGVVAGEAVIVAPDAITVERRSVRLTWWKRRPYTDSPRGPAFHTMEQPCRR